MRVWPRVLCTAAFAAFAYSASAQIPVPNGTSGDWAVYTAGTGASRVCYALANPKNSLPTGVKRSPIFFLVSTWPDGKIANQPSVVPGYPYRDGSKAQVRVGAASFDFFTRNTGTEGGAWIEDEADERRLVDAMKAGATMVVTGTSTRGTVTTDNYSLAGFGAALDKIAQTCK